MKKWLLLLGGFGFIISCSKIEQKITQQPAPTPLSSYNMSAYSNGDFLTFNATASVTNSNLSIQGQWVVTNLNETYNLVFSGITISKGYVGNYELKGFLKDQYDAYITHPNPSGYVFYYASDSTNNSGALSITAFDSINKTISGTFNFTANGGAGDVSAGIYTFPTSIIITNGVFTKVPLY